MGAARILVAEDEHGISSFLDGGLRAAGFSTKVVEDGSSALALARTGEFDLMILDLGLPARDGLSVLEELRQQGNRLPVVILTARSELDDMVGGLDLGADDYVTKPFRFEELSAREFALAEVFFRNAGHVLSREQLLSRVWGYDYDPGSNVVDVYVGYLRKKLGEGRIATVRGMGYRLEGGVSPD